MLATPPADNGLGGRLAIREVPGGCGNAAALTDLRIVLVSAVTLFGVGRAKEGRLEVEELPRGVIGLELGVWCAEALRPSGLSGICEEGAAIPLTWGVFVVNVAKAAVFLGLGVGSGGSAAVGGPKDGREGLGIVAAMFSLCRLPLLA